MAIFSFANDHEQVLGHVSGLQSAGIQALRKNGFAICQWEKMVNIMAEAEPEGSPGDKEVYHALSFGWIVGGIIERVAKMPLRGTFTENWFLYDLLLCFGSKLRH